MDWRQFVMDLDQLNPDRVEEVFARHGAGSIAYSDAGDNPVLEPRPGEAPLWSETRISGLFSPDTDFAALQNDLLESLGIDALPRHEIEQLADRDWERQWLRDFAPMRFGGRLWICPGDSTIDDPDAVVVRLDPGLAFGTGTHPTTALCLEWLDGLSLADKSVLDYGCGSGILAVAALRLGCSRAAGYDIDPQAISATRANAGKNGVADRLSATLDPAQMDPEYDLVVANILAGPLIEHAASIAGHLGNESLLALSGILSQQADDVMAAYSPWIEFDTPAEKEQDGQTWVRLTGRRIEG
ncbi:MAG TPA: 50S ribosomal protein L11 methyltransferase [Woeseiaceae bacterium]|jgi:ribosomal protein L11 methyltransferase|nr:50S ribosomal protein L11 methyltransferase [Woeseiaceae bacterium]